MKYKAVITNELNGKQYMGSFDSETDRDLYIQTVLNKRVLGLQEREMLKEHLEPNLENRVIAYRGEVVEKEVQVLINGELVPQLIPQTIEYVTVKSDFRVELSEENNYAELRQKEYPGLDQVLHILLDHGLDSPEFVALQELRSNIKLKYPKV